MNINTNININKHKCKYINKYKNDRLTVLLSLWARESWVD